MKIRKNVAAYARNVFVSLALAGFAWSVAPKTWFGLPPSHSQKQFDSHVLDAEWYRYIALGHRAGTPKPFCYRVLSPMLAWGVTAATGTTLERGFQIVAFLATFLLITLTLLLVERFAYGWLWVLPLGLLPFWGRMLGDFYFPDVLHAALLALFLYFLSKEQPVAAAFVLPVMFAARESTVLVAVIILALVLIQRRTTATNFLIPLGIGSVAGLGLTIWIGTGGGPNVHEMNSLIYFTGKIPWNLTVNVLGVRLWSNTIDICTPIWKMTLPRFAALGQLKDIGVCEVSLRYPSRTLLIWLSTFGLGPLLLFLSLRRRLFLEMWNSASLVLRFCFLYGSLSFVLAPALGASRDRLTGYGWPLFFIGLPWLLSRSFELSRSKVLTLGCLHVSAAWIGFGEGYEGLRLLGVVCTYVASILAIGRGPRQAVRMLGE